MLPQHLPISSFPQVSNPVSCHPQSSKRELTLAHPPPTFTLRYSTIFTTEGAGTQYETTMQLKTESSQSLKQPPQGCGRVPITGGFQDAIGQHAR